MLLCDYDGTLTTIVDSPEKASLSDETRNILNALAHKSNMKVGIISGRAITDIKEKVQIGGIIFAGNHGFEIEGPGIKFIHPLTAEISSLIHIIGTILARTLGKIPGVLIEDKGVTLSVHYRMVDEEKLPQFTHVFENTVGTARKLGKFKTTFGKKVNEIRPAVEWNKGKAVSLIFDKYTRSARKGSVLPIYLGDDLTDEDAFKTVNDLGGISILVGDTCQSSAAGYYLNSTSEVNSFLSEMLKIL
ncbi:MAG: trehalose-phosphatase [Dehalococcoidia bacterium]|nr:trehalose-phosphatase [Dehalococcoidia bacterium]